MNQERFPSIAKSARNVFFVQATPVASESAFSLAGNSIASKRNKLSDESVTALMLLKSWQRFLDK